jgi:hypothetical protein
LELKYFVPFKAQDGFDAQFALRERLLNIEGMAIDSSVNANKWQVPPEDLDFLVQSLISAQLRIDHAESAMSVIGRVPDAKKVGEGVVWFRAEIGDLPIIERVIRGYLDHVSIQLDSDDVQCSKCLKQTRKEGMLVHLCPGAWEIVHKPKVRELSIVASPAYKDTIFKPVGFAAAMNETQVCKAQACTGEENCGRKGSFICGLSKLSQGNKDGGSKGDLQEPDKQKENSTEVNSLPEQGKTGQQASSPQKAQGVVNVNNGQGESTPTQVNYTDFMQQLESLQNQIASDDAAEAEAMRARISALQKQIQNRATKQQLGKKISDLQQQLTQQNTAEDAGDDAMQPSDDGDTDTSDDGAVASKKSKKASGKGLVGSPAQSEQPGMAGDTTMSVFGNTDWFRDVAKATAKMKKSGMQ